MQRSINEGGMNEVIQPGVFLSHTWSDKPFARRLADDLRAAGVFVWIDEAEIRVGDSLIQKIREGIDRVDFVAVVLSPRSVRSEWVQRELDVAMNQEIKGRRIKVLPLMYEACDLPGFLEGKMYADFTRQSEYHLAFAQVLRRLGITASTQPRKETLVLEASGTWTGKWEHRGARRDATLEITTQTSPPTAVMTISYAKGDSRTEVREQFDVEVQDGRLRLVGTGYSFVRRGQARGWHLDVFDLRLEPGENVLAGVRTDSHGRSCPVEFSRPILLTLDVGAGTTDFCVLSLRPEFADGVDAGALVRDLRAVALRHVAKAKLLPPRQVTPRGESAGRLPSPRRPPKSPRRDAGA